jgi:hypothetical protein
VGILEKFAAVGEDSMHHLRGRFAHDHLVSSDESNHGVRVLLDELDQLGIEDERVSIQSGQLNHWARLLSIHVIGGKRENLKES